MRVLIAYDGSAGAEQTLTLAGSVDWPPDSTLRIATVIEPTLLFVGAPMAGGFDVPSPEVDAQITAYQQEQVSEGGREPPIGGPHGGRHRSARPAGNGSP